MYRYKKYFFYVLFLCILPARLAMAAPEEDLSLTADAAILIEASTGKVLFEKNADKEEGPASTTKMTTLLVALEESHLAGIVHAGPDAVLAGGASVHLEAGDEIRLRDLLQAMMLASGNDAAVAVAEHVAGSVPAFAEKMNALAVKMEAYHTHFVNANGLTTPGHYSTARDLAKIARYGMQNPVFRQMVGVKSMEIQWQKPAGKKFVFENTNELLGVYPGISGVKTGYTEAAGECLVASARRNQTELIAVVLHTADDQRFKEAARLLDYGFARVKMEKALKKDDFHKTIRVHGGIRPEAGVSLAADIFYPMTGDDKERYSLRTELPRYVQAPVEAGDVVGNMAVLYDGKVVRRVPLLATDGVSEGFNIWSFLGAIYDGILDRLHISGGEMEK